MTPLPVLELDQVVKSYPGDPPLEVLHGVSLTIFEGDLVAIVGPSGCGKSTLLHLMGTLDRPSAGTVRVTGVDIAGLSDRELSALRATRIGFVFQQFFLSEHQTAVDNVADGLLYAGASLEERKRLAVDALGRVGLVHRALHHPTKLSGGERQRVAIARSIVNNPTLILADEPTGNLDSVNGAAIMDLLFDLHRARGVTLVIVTHDPGHAKRCARRIQIKDGQVFEQSSVGAHEVAS